MTNSQAATNAVLPELWTCDRCGLSMNPLAKSLHDALHEHVQPTTPKPPDPRIDEILTRVRAIEDALEILMGLKRGR